MKPSTHPNRRHIIALAAAATLPLPALAQADRKPLRIVSGYAPGGGTDLVARIIGEKLQEKLGVPVIVENKPGAGGRLAAQQLRGAPAAERVLMIANPAVMVVAPLVYKSNGYDPHTDFQMVSLVNEYDFGISVATAVPVRELSHLLAWLKANPQQANFGVPATASLPHFFALMLAQRAKVEAQIVGYRGSGPLNTDLMGGQIPVSVDTFETVLPLHEGGRLRILATSGTKRSTFAPNIPTFKEAGIDLAANGWNALFAPASMPAEEVGKLAETIRQIMQDRGTLDKFKAAKLTPVAAGKAESEEMLRKYRAQWEPVVKASGIQQ